MHGVLRSGFTGNPFKCPSPHHGARPPKGNYKSPECMGFCSVKCRQLVEPLLTTNVIRYLESLMDQFRVYEALGQPKNLREEALRDVLDVRGCLMSSRDTADRILTRGRDRVELRRPSAVRYNVLANSDEFYRIAQEQREMEVRGWLDVLVGFG